MAREPKNVGTKLGALLDERDHLRIKISLAEERGVDSEILQMREKIVSLDREIESRWKDA